MILKLRDAYRVAEELGCNVYVVRGTGEQRFQHPLVAKTLRVNLRRKDAPGSLQAFFNRVRRAQAALKDTGAS